MTPYEMIRDHLDAAVPFARHVGIDLVEIGDGTARATLDQREAVSNHIQTVHAGAMFTLAEAASGAAVAGALAPVILKMRPVAAEAQIRYMKIAQGRLTAKAKTARPGADLMEAIRTDGKVSFAVDVDLSNEAAETVAEMTVTWHVSPAR